ncbi:Zinc finger C2H2 [Penicillium sp. CMV-2018d]|nr:Zinc finger C2H2 [Penicillium sp. CMV-2018d]
MMKDPKDLKDPKTIVQRRSIGRNLGQDTSDTLLSRWTREAVAGNYDPFGRPGPSIDESVLGDVSKRKGKASQEASLITEPNFDEQVASPAKPVENHEHPVITTTTSPSASTSTTNISFAVIQCLKDLSRLVSEDLSSFASEVPPALWKDELGRLRVWAANIGAHQTGQSSLDHRLRDASHIKEQTLRVLQRLQRTIEDINDILHHSLGDDDDDFSDLSGDEDDDEHQSEMQSIYHALRDTINNLFQMSMLIRQPAQHDRLLGTKRSDAVFYEQFDQRHVSDKYPQAREDISKRLGLAISQRRAVMQYRERHRTKLGQGLDQVIEDQIDGQSAKLSDTVATEFVEISPAANDNLESLTVASQTSYAQTILNGMEGTVLPSPPKDSANGAPFECPYCFVMITIANRRAWARHVFNDLMPYLCVFPSCPTPHRLYESRREWFSHLQSQHSISETPNVHVDCPLCLSSLPSGRQLERHVGRHLEELALFALPRSEEDDDDAPISSDEDSDKSHDPVDEGRCPQCDLVFTDLRAHAMTHNETERPEKCPIVTCVYHAKGFARKYDMNRHLLTHYKGVMVCQFCPGVGTSKETSFNRADVFKRHLVAVYGVKQLQPNQLDQSPTSSIKTDTDHTGDTTGNCSICNEPFGDAQDFYKHLDNCVMLKVMQGSSEPVKNMRLPEVSEDEETVDGRRYSSSSVRSQDEDNPYPRKGKTHVPRHLAHIPTIIDLGYPFKEEEDLIVIQRSLSKAQIDKVLGLSRESKQPSPVGDSQSAKETELPDDISTEMQGKNNLSKFWCLKETFDYA